MTIDNNPLSQGHGVSSIKEQPELQIKTWYLFHCPNSRLDRNQKLLSQVYTSEFSIN